MDNIKLLLREILKDEFSNKLAFVGKVISVDGTLAEIQNIESNGIYDKVRLQAHPGSGVLVIPTVDSYVIVGRMTGGGGYIAMTSDVDSIQLLDGSYGGLIKIDDIVQKLNVLEKRMGDHQHITTTAGNPTTPDLVSNPPIPETTVEELENPNISHGVLP